MDKSRMSATQPFNVVEGFSIKGVTATGNVILELSPAAIDLLLRLAEIARPTIKAKSYRREVERGEAALEQLNESEREVKNKLLADLRDPEAQFIAQHKHFPGD